MRPPFRSLCSLLLCPSWAADLVAADRRRKQRQERRLPVGQLPRRHRTDARLSGSPPGLHRLPRRQRQYHRQVESARGAANPQLWPSSANPVRSYTLLNQESPDYVRFRNPGDLRVADRTAAHPLPRGHRGQSPVSMMSHGAFLWGAALYNNGAFPAQTLGVRRKLRPQTVQPRKSKRAGAVLTDEIKSKPCCRSCGRCHSSKPPSPVTPCASSSAAMTV